MDTIQNALKELYYSLGGSASTVEGIADIDKLILAIAALGVGAQITAASAKELPAVDDSDAGKVLTVSAEGKWEAATSVKELPAVDGEDAGKVLTVSNEGKWEAADLPS